MTNSAGSTYKAIQQLKKANDAIIMAHYYQPLEIQDLADFVGDSFDLSRKAQHAKEQMILFCGVNFMAETAKILSPQKTVIIPDSQAICPMAGMVGWEDIQALKYQYPEAAVVGYVNTTATTKTACDVCVTSSSADRIVNQLSADTIIFVPDQNLADYIRRRTQKRIITAEGYCYVHHRFQLKHIQAARDNYPEAVVLVHPECSREVIDNTDEALSTAGMINYVQNSTARVFIIGTEEGLIERLQRMFPDKRFFSAGPANMCSNMKKISVKDIYEALKGNRQEITLSDEVIRKASVPLKRMIELNR